MEVPFVDLKGQYQRIKTEIDAAIQSVLDSGQFIGGRFVQEFESAFSTLLGATYCVGVANGTDAIWVALKALGVERDDEVITPAFGWISSSEMITLAGGSPVFADILADTYTLDPLQLESKITSKTKGVVVIHLYGQAAHVHEIKRICEKHNLFLIEDCAQAHWTQESGIPVGRIGDAGTFSFYPTKNLGAYGDAGCIITSQPQVEEKMRAYANHGGLNKHLMEGINSRLDPLQAAMLKAKMVHLSRWTEQRIENARLYNTLLAGIQPITLPANRPDARHTFHQYVIRTSERDELRKFLMDHQIQTMIHYPSALPNLPAYSYLKYSREDFPVASQSEREVLSLPVYAELSREQIQFVCDKIKTFFGQSH